MIYINNEKWEIHLVSPFHHQLKRSDGTFSLGVCDDNLKSIYINSELSPFYIKRVLCHELTHAAMFSYNIDLTLEQEELLADLMATYGQEIIYITNGIFKRIKEKEAF